MTFTLKAQSLFFYAFKTFVNIQLINRYADGCHDTSCITCHIIAHNHSILTLTLTLKKIYFDINEKDKQQEIDDMISRYQ